MVHGAESDYGRHSTGETITYLSFGHDHEVWTMNTCPVGAIRYPGTSEHTVPYEADGMV